MAEIELVFLARWRPPPRNLAAEAAPECLPSVCQWRLRAPWGLDWKPSAPISPQKGGRQLWGHRRCVEGSSARDSWRRSSGCKTRSGQEMEGRGGVHATGGQWSEGCWECAENCGQVASNARPGQLAWRPLGLGPGVMSVRVNMTLGTRFLEAAWDSGWGPVCGIRADKA